MSGIEAAGLAFGLLPLLVSAARNYKTLSLPFKRHERLSREAYRLKLSLDVQKAIFNNQCRILLERKLQHDVASSMLDGFDHPLWSDSLLEEQLAEILGPSYQTLVRLAREIEKQVKKAEDVIIKLFSGLEREHNVPADGDTSWKQRLLANSRGVLNRRSFDSILKDLRESNQDFQALSIQIIHDYTSRDVTTSTDIRKTERFNYIRQASQHVYEALKNVCSQCVEHLAHFCVEPQSEFVHSGQDILVQFSIAFTKSVDLKSLSWFKVGSISTATRLPSAVRNASYSPSKQHHGLSQAQVCEEIDYRITSGSSQTSSLQPTPITQAESAIEFPDMQRPENICAIKNNCYQGDYQYSDRVEGSKVQNSSKITVHLNPESTQIRHQTPRSLSQIIEGATACQTMEVLSSYSRVRLARLLAVAVLRYHSTPWLRPSWQSKNVHFYGLSGDAFREDVPSLPLPHLDARIINSSDDTGSACNLHEHTIVRNPLLFRLGIILLEIAYISTWEELSRPVDSRIEVEEQHSDFLTARRLVAVASKHLGPTYCKVTDRLIECDFGCGCDLHNPELQVAFYDKIILPLDSLERKLHGHFFDAANA